MTTATCVISIMTTYLYRVMHEDSRDDSRHVVPEEYGEKHVTLSRYMMRQRIYSNSNKAQLPGFLACA
jgi:hypothetical protein